MSDAPERLGPYRIHGALGEGGMGVVYLGEHEVSGQRAAIKTVRLPEEEALSGLRREIHALAQIRHPGVVRVFEQGTEDGIPWYAMELIEGRSLVDSFAWGQAPLVDKLLPALRILRELCVTLAYLHGEGIIHRDLKPENILLDEDLAPVLVDFGLASRSPGAVGREILDVALPQGTVSYMAPELILGQFVDARADLYAVGCLLYEAVTGRPPFVAYAPAKVLQQHLSVPPRPPSDLVKGVPPALSALILGLLEKSPRKRPGHADDIARALVALGAAPLRRGPLPPPRPYVYRPELAGGSAVLDELVERLERAHAREGSAVLLRGESGIGKTYLALAAAREAAEWRFTVIAGACVPVAACPDEGPPSSSSNLGPVGLYNAALHPFRPLLQAVLDRCLAQGPSVTAALLGGRGKLLAPYAPGLATLPGQADLAEPPELTAEAAHKRLLRAFAETIFAFAREAPLLLILDDLQWADDLSLDLLALLAEPRLSSEQVLILGTYRAEETSPALLTLEERPEVRRIDVGRLDQASVASMVRDMLALEVVPAALVAFLHEQAAGNPFFVAEYIRTAVTLGLLRRSEQGRWEVAAAPSLALSYERLPLPGSLRELVIRHLGLLSPEARSLALAASVIGRDMEAELLEEVAGLGAVATMNALGELALRHVFEVPVAGRVRFLHDKLREVAYTEIPAEARGPLHLRAGRAIEQRHRGSPEFSRYYPRLAHHFTRAGSARDAIEYLEKAGQEALRSFANREAVGFLRDLVALGHEALLGAEAAMAARDLSSIVDIVRRRRLGERDRLSLVRWERQLAEAYHFLGDGASALRHASRALGWAGRKAPSREQDWGMRLLREVPVQVAHRLLPRALWTSDDEMTREVRGEIANALRRMASGSFFAGAPLRLLTVSLWSVNEAEAAGRELDAARGYAAVGLALSSLRLSRVGLRYVSRARDMVERGNDEAAQATCAWVDGIVMMWCARWDEARVAIAKAEAIAERLGDRQELEQYRLILMMIHFWTGDLEGGARDASFLARSAEERGDLRNLGLGLLGAIFSLVRLGRLDEAEERLKQMSELSLTEDTELGREAGRALISLSRGDLEAAVAPAEQAVARVRLTMPLFVQWCVYCVALEIHLGRWEAARGARPGVAEEAARSAWKVLRSFFRSSLRFALCAPFYHELKGRAHRIAGSPRRARASEERALSRSRALQMPYPEARAHLELARLSPPASAARAAHLDAAVELFQQMGCQPDLSACQALREGAGQAEPFV